MHNKMIRNLDYSDMSLILEMISACDIMKYAKTDTLDTLHSYFMQGCMIIGIFSEKELAGYAILSRRDGNSVDELFKRYHVKNREVRGHVGILNNCIVRDKYRGRGYQLELLKKREEVIRKLGLKDIFTAVHGENNYCINNLLKSGYKQIGQHIIQKEWMLFGKSIEESSNIVEQSREFD